MKKRKIWRFYENYDNLDYEDIPGDYDKNWVDEF